MQENLSREEDFSVLSLPDLLTHKGWKARCFGYETLLRQWKDLEIGNTEMRKYVGTMKSILSDANVAALDLGFQVTNQFVIKCDVAAKYRKELIPLVVEKGLGSSRPSTKSQAQDMLINFAYIDHPDPVLEELVLFFEHKQPKIVSSVVSAIAEILRIFGIPPASPKILVKELAKPFKHSDPGVRSEATKLALEIHGWIGEGVFSFLSDLKPIQIKELQEESIKRENPSPENRRRLRSQEDTTQIEAGSEKNQEKIDVAPVETIDVYDLAEPVHLSCLIPPGFLEGSLTSSVWKERKEILDSFFEKLESPNALRIQSSKPIVDSILGALAKRVSSDVNVQVVVVATKCIEKIVIGLRKGVFSSGCSSTLIAALLERSKEKKGIVLEAIRSALDGISSNSSSIGEQIIVPALVFLGHKNPQVRTETLLWITRLLSNLKKAPGRGDLALMLGGQEAPSLLGLLKQQLDDGQTEVREAAFSLFGCLVKLFSISHPLLQKNLNQLDKIKMSRIQEKADTTMLNFSPAVPITNAQTIKPVPNEITRVSTKTVIPSSEKRKSLSVQTNAAGVGGMVSHRCQSVSSFGNSVVWNMDMAREHVSSIVGIETTDSFLDASWKTRQLAVEDSMKKISVCKGDENFDMIFFYFLTLASKESVVSIVNIVLMNLLDMLKNHKVNSGGLLGHMVSIGLVDRLGDPKLKGPLGILLQELMWTGGENGEGSGLAAFAECLRVLRSPKAVLEGLGILIRVVQDGRNDKKSIPIKAKILAPLLAVQLSAAHGPVRKIASSLVQALRAIGGDSIRTCLQLHVSESLLSIEFSRPQEPDDNLIRRLNDADWQIRKSALDSVAIGTKNIKGADLFEMMEGLRRRLDDSNRNLAIQAMDVMCLLLENNISDLDKILKSLLGGILVVLCDSKQSVRSAAFRVLDIFLNHGSDMLVFYMFHECLARLVDIESPIFRKELLSWMSFYASKNEYGKKYFDTEMDFVSNVLQRMNQDKSAEIRKLAQFMSRKRQEERMDWSDVVVCRQRFKEICIGIEGVDFSNTKSVVSSSVRLCELLREGNEDVRRLCIANLHGILVGISGYLCSDSVLECLEAILDLLADGNIPTEMQRLLDQEAIVVFPELIRVASIDTRVASKMLFSKSVLVYPPSKIFSLILEIFEKETEKRIIELGIELYQRGATCKPGDISKAVSVSREFFGAEYAQEVSRRLGGKSYDPARETPTRIPPKRTTMDSTPFSPPTRKKESTMETPECLSQRLSGLSPFGNRMNISLEIPREFRLDPPIIERTRGFHSPSTQGSILDSDSFVVAQNSILSFTPPSVSLDILKVLFEKACSPDLKTCLDGLEMLHSKVSNGVLNHDGILRLFSTLADVLEKKDTWNDGTEKGERILGLLLDMSTEFSQISFDIVRRFFVVLIPLLEGSGRLKVMANMVIKAVIEKGDRGSVLSILLDMLREERNNGKVSLSMQCLWRATRLISEGQGQSDGAWIRTVVGRLHFFLEEDIEGLVLRTLRGMIYAMHEWCNRFNIDLLRIVAESVGTSSPVFIYLQKGKPEEQDTRGQLQDGVADSFRERLQSYTRMFADAAAELRAPEISKEEMKVVVQSRDDPMISLAAQMADLKQRLARIKDGL